MEKRTTQRKRIEDIDVLRGMAMCIVVLGHAIQTTYAEADSFLIYRVITSVQMPLFMYISGYVTFNPDRIIDKFWLMRRCKLLIIPFLSWILVPFILKGDYDFSTWGGRICTVIQHPGNGLWFLLVLFYCCVMLYVPSAVCRYTSNNKLLAICIVIEILVVKFLMYMLFFYDFGLQELAWMSPFYFLGYYSGKWKALRISRKWKVLVSFLFVVLVKYYRRTDVPVFLIHIDLPYPYLEILTSVYNDILAVFGIIMVAFLAEMISGWIKKVLIEIGKKTLEVYVMHLLFLGIAENIGNPVVCTIVKFFTCLTLPILTASVLYSGNVTLILFGKTRGVDVLKNND